jgi:flagellum-specific peptidoglycan hydrolase FlgJ
MFQMGFLGSFEPRAQMYLKNLQKLGKYIFHILLQYGFLTDFDYFRHLNTIIGQFKLRRCNKSSKNPIPIAI